MARKLQCDRLVLATHNKGKVQEIADLLSPFGLSIISAGELGLEEPAETGTTYAENATIKALASALPSGLPALSDDSGLSVDVLGGAPGVYSADWAGQPRDFGRAMALVEEKLAALGARAAAQRRAHFVCTLCVAWPDGHTELFEGRVNGTLVWPPRGTRGFGYDAMFLPENESLTFGEMQPSAKHAMSHRARAFAALVTACLGEARTP